VVFIQVERKYVSLEIINYLQEFSYQIIELFSSIFPILLCVTFVTVNLSLILGAIVYLLDYNEENGKMMILRSLTILTLLIFVFNPNFPNSIEVTEPFEGFQSLTSFITSYLLFIFASLSLIVFLGNLGLYLISSDTKRIKTLKKSIFCLVCVILPLGFQFPNMPLWRT
jgi:succinate dehydrogenase hydrophobic anchor subunit